MINYAYLDIGFGYRVLMSEVFAIMPLDIKSVYQLYSRKKKEGLVFRATRGREGRSLLLLKDGHAFVSAYTPAEIAENVHDLNVAVARGVNIQ